jgi:hypothetical protein
MAKKPDTSPQLKTTYGTLSRRKVITLLRDNKVWEVWKLCLVVAGFEPTEAPMKYAGRVGGAPSRIYAQACATKKIANPDNLKGDGRIARNLFMEWLKTELFADGIDDEATHNDVVARTVQDYIQYKKTKEGSPEREALIKALPDHTPKGKERYQKMDTLLQETMKKHGLKRPQAVDYLFTQEHPLTRSEDGKVLEKGTFDKYCRMAWIEKGKKAVKS